MLRTPSHNISLIPNRKRDESYKQFIKRLCNTPNPLAGEELLSRALFTYERDHDAAKKMVAPAMYATVKNMFKMGMRCPSMYDMLPLSQRSYLEKHADLEDYPKTLGALLACARKRKGLTQENLAQLLGYKSSGSVHSWESNFARPPEKMIPKLCEALDLNPGYFKKEGNCYGV